MRENDAPTTLDRHLCFAVYSASHAFTRFYKPRLEALGLTYPQYLVMLVLWEKDALPVNGIGEKLSLDSGTLTPLLKRLEAAGFVARNRNPQDERKVHIMLTDQGRDLQAKAKEIILPSFAALGLEQEQAFKLHQELENLRQVLEQTTRLLAECDG